MRFFKNNSDNIIKLFINQIGVAIFSMFLYTAAGAINSNDGTRLIIKVMISVFAIAFYFVLIYTVTWEIGAKDKIRIDGGRMEPEEKKGVLLGLYANAFNVAVIGIAIILYSVFLISGAEGFRSAFAILNLIFRFFASMYLGMIQLITASITDENMLYLIQTVLFFVFSFFTPFVSWLGYKLGRRDFRLFPQTSKKQ